MDAIDLGIVNGAVSSFEVANKLARFMEIHRHELWGVQLTLDDESTPRAHLFRQRAKLLSESVSPKVLEEIVAARPRIEEMLSLEFPWESAECLLFMVTAHDIGRPEAKSLVKDRLGNIPPTVGVWSCPSGNPLDIFATFGFSERSVFLVGDTRYQEAVDYLDEARHYIASGSDLGLT